MRLKANFSTVAPAAMLLVIGGLLGCGHEPESARDSAGVANENAATRSAVPLTRPITLGSLAELANLEFDLPPPGPNSSGTLTLGLRVSGEDSAQSAAIADRLVEAGLAANVVLTRTGETKGMALIRRDFNGHSPTRLVSVDPDGHVPGVVRDTVDVTALREAGLERNGIHYRTLAFAWAENIPPGRYSLKVQLLDQPEDLATLKAELLVAYQHRAK
jgi:hypothetical protein